MTHRTDAQDDSLVYANTQTRVEVSRPALPLSCPLPDQKLWNAHPRVYLPIEETGEISCPYCGTHYVLTNQASCSVVPAASAPPGRRRQSHEEPDQ